MLHVRIVFCLCLVVPFVVICKQLEEDNCKFDQCFHQPPENCPSNTTNCRCKQLDNCRNAVICCNVTEFEVLENLACAGVMNNGLMQALHIRNAHFEKLNVSLNAWRTLKYMSVTDGYIKSVVGKFKKITPISCLNLSSNGITNFQERPLGDLYNLSVLDVSHNNLSDVPSFKKEGNMSLDISGNPPLLCQKVYNALNRTGLNFLNVNETFCLSTKNFRWFKSIERLPLNACILLHHALKNCVKNCTCEPERINIVNGNHSIVVSMNCTDKGFLSLPTPLPPNTVSLNISNNNITSLQEINDPSYENLILLYADNNKITSIKPLEGSQFIYNFIMLTLRNNSIKTLESYVLSNIKFDRNYYNRKINLGGNNLQCDCNAAKDLKAWLLTKQMFVEDYNDIRCENLNSRVVDLNPSKMCLNHDQDWTDYIYYIIAAEVLLLVGLIAKVSYDYWVFKTAGYLPWPASKMPKLPCDWLCE